MHRYGETKRRPALLVSVSPALGARLGQSVMARITRTKNAPWPLAVASGDLGATGLPTASGVRRKRFTLAHRLVLNTRGVLAQDDQSAIRRALHTLLGRQLT